MTTKKPTAPTHLSPEAKRKWADLQREYGITDAYGLTLLQSAMESFDRIAEARAAITATGGPVVPDSRGSVKANPACAIERDAKHAMLAALRALNVDAG